MSYLCYLCLFTKAEEYVVYNSNFQIIFRSIHDMFFQTLTIFNTDLNCLTTKLLSFYCVYGKINSVLCLTYVFSKFIVYKIAMKLSSKAACNSTSIHTMVGLTNILRNVS
jgi:hypothetical protein